MNISVQIPDCVPVRIYPPKGRTVLIHIEHDDKIVGTLAVGRDGYHLIDDAGVMVTDVGCASGRQSSLRVRSSAA